MNSENKLSHKDTMSAEANTKSPHTEEKSSTNVSPKHAGTAADGMEETMRENHPTIQIPKTGVLESELAVKFSFFFLFIYGLITK